VLIASGLSAPLFLTAPPADNTRLFIVEQGGPIRVVRGGQLLTRPFLDVTPITRSPANGGQGEQGLLGMAFHPNYAQNGFFYIFYTPVSGGRNILTRYTRSSDSADVANPNSGVEMFSVTHPFAFHNGGMVAFGPADGYLYLSSGDGGDLCDHIDNAQSGAVDMGKILRIDVNQTPAIVPESNPFVGVDGINDEIWAMGLRNPWRFSFDRGTADIFIADVGQGQREEIDYQPAASPGGENYGWNLYEGFDCPNPSCGSATCSVAGYVPPILNYDHAVGCAVTGGYVYRGCRMPDLAGTYFYSDFCSAFIRTFRRAGGSVTDERDRTAEMAPGGGLAIASVTSFGEASRGEIYIVDGGGEVYKIVPAFFNLEVSGEGAPPFSTSAATWTWEVLPATTSQSVTAYHVYRATSASGPFDCIHASPTPSWPGGDASVPPVKSAFFYLVTAISPSGEETSAGTSTSGSPRPLSAAPCPP